MGTFSLDRWFEELESDNMVVILPLNGKIVLDSKQLGVDFPKDPADQLIAARPVIITHLF